jgi:DNA-directed RNA polymerase specialized sigma24 family protein
LTEQQLIHALQARQESAFQLLVETYKNRLYNTVLGFIQNEADAEDILQEVFIRVYENIQSFKGEAALGTWMYRIAVSQALDHLRRKKRKKRASGLLSWFSPEEYDRYDKQDFNHPGIVDYCPGLARKNTTGMTNRILITPV